MGEYQDFDGNPCSLHSLCVAEPEWAVNHIERLTTEGEVMRKALERIANYNGNQRLTREADDMADIAREALVSRS